MNARTPIPASPEADYAIGEALCLSNQPMPHNPPDGVMAGFLDALEPRERPDALWANGPGMREPFTQRAADMPPPKPRGNDAEILRSAPQTLSIVDERGELLRLQEMKLRYLRAVVAHCRGNISMAARLLGEHRRSVERMLAKRVQRP